MLINKVVESIGMSGDGAMLTEYLLEITSRNHLLILLDFLNKMSLLVMAFSEITATSVQ